MTKKYVKYKTFKELKEELGEKFEEYMYEANIELLKKINKAIEYTKNKQVIDLDHLEKILIGEDK